MNQLTYNETDLINVYGLLNQDSEPAVEHNSALVAFMVCVSAFLSLMGVYSAQKLFQILRWRRLLRMTKQKVQPESEKKADRQSKNNPKNEQ